MSVVSQKATSFFGNISWKNRSTYTGDISEESVVCTVLISAIIVEIFRKKNIPISYIIPYKNLASPLIPVCLKKSHMILLFYSAKNGLNKCGMFFVFAHSSQHRIQAWRGHLTGVKYLSLDWLYLLKIISHVLWNVLTLMNVANNVIVYLFREKKK